MTDIVLVNPLLTGRDRYGSLAAGGVYSPPMGLASLAAFIRQSGYSVKILDCCALNLDVREGTARILAEKPAYVGITMATCSVGRAAALAAALKRSDAGLKIIAGGCHVSSLPAETMEAFPQFDIGVIGEGEETAVELLKALGSGGDPGAVNGIIYRKDGRLITTPPRALIRDLDTLPFPAWDLLPDIARFYKPSCFGFKYLPSASIITMRGCPMRCSFCTDGPFAKTCRMHSPEYVVGMMKFLKSRHGIRDIMIYDGTFIIDKERVEKICRLMIEEKLDLAWSCNGRIDLMSRDTLKLMKRAGCWAVAYGIESGSQEALDFMRKNIDLARAREVIAWTKDAGLLTKGYFMIGHLLETRESLRRTADFMRSSGLDLATISYYTPLPGTLDYGRAAGYGSFNNDWDSLSMHNIVFVPKGLDAETLRGYRREMVRRFYFRPGIIFRYLKLLLTPGSFALVASGLFAVLNLLFFENLRGTAPKRPVKKPARTPDLTGKVL